VRALPVQNQPLSFFSGFVGYRIQEIAAQ